MADPGSGPGGQQASGHGDTKPAAPATAAAAAPAASKQQSKPATNAVSPSVVLARVGLCLLISALGLFLGYRTVGKLPLPDRGSLLRPQHKTVFTSEQLKQFDGEEGRPYYLAVMGEVFDVTAGERFYGKGEGYHGFIGRDASRSFVTGDFVNDLNDDVKDFDEQDSAGLLHWRTFFRNHDTYKFKGKVVGAFYDATGKATAEVTRVEQLAAKAKSAEQLMAEQAAKYPNCNSRWNAAAGGFVWCDDGMYPRKLITQVPGSSQVNTRCACFVEMGWSDIRQVYPDCSPDAHECQTTPPGPAPDPFARKKKRGADKAAASDDTQAASAAAEAEL